MDPSPVAALIGLLVCIGAVVGLCYTFRPLESDENKCHTPRGKDRASLIMALLLGIFLLGMVMSGRYSDPKYAEAMAKLPPHKRYLQRSSYPD